MPYDVNFWTALGACVAAVSTWGALVVHIVRYAYRQGRTDQQIEALRERIASIEAATNQVSPLRETMAALGATVDGLAKAVDKMDQAFSERLDQLTSRLPNPSSRRSQTSA